MISAWKVRKRLSPWLKALGKSSRNWKGAWRTTTGWISSSSTSSHGSRRTVFAWACRWSESPRLGNRPTTRLTPSAQVESRPKPAVQLADLPRGQLQPAQTQLAQLPPPRRLPQGAQRSGREPVAAEVEHFQVLQVRRSRQGDDGL